MLRTPKSDESVVIYETLKLRSTGSHTQVIDLRPNGEKYAIRCVTHDHTVARNVRLASEAESHKSHTWCPECTLIERAPKVTPATVNPLASAWAAVFTNEADKARDPRFTVEFILDSIGNATSRKTCEKKVKEALAA